MACGTGFSLDVPPEPKTGNIAGLIRIYRLETKRVGGKIRCSADTTRQNTEAFVPIETRDVERHGFKTQTIVFEIADVPCPYCSAHRLKLNINDDDICPSCSNRGLRKTLIWGSFV
jgi:hypothetical protein